MTSPWRHKKKIGFLCHSHSWSCTVDWITFELMSLVIHSLVHLFLVTWRQAHKEIKGLIIGPSSSKSYRKWFLQNTPTLFLASLRAYTLVFWQNEPTNGISFSVLFFVWYWRNPFATENDHWSLYLSTVHHLYMRHLYSLSPSSEKAAISFKCLQTNQSQRHISGRLFL